MHVMLEQDDFIFGEQPTTQKLKARPIFHGRTMACRVPLVWPTHNRALQHKLIPVILCSSGRDKSVL